MGAGPDIDQDDIPFQFPYRAPLKTWHFGEGKEAARGKPECMGEYMRM